MIAPRIDAHLHVWDLERAGYGWLGPEQGPLYRSFDAREAHAELVRACFGGAVLVQADDSREETGYLLEVAEANEWVLGVVGWVQLDDPAAATADLDRWTAHPAFCGVRHLVHADRRSDFLERAEVRASLRLVAARGLPFDVPDAWPRHLAQATDVARALPELTLVVDHLAKPPFGRADFADWRDAIRCAAASPNTVAKVSGLRTPSAGFDARTLLPAWEVALECFGPNRLMYGGDWPMTVPYGDYEQTWRVVGELIGMLSPAEQDQILSRTAARVYRLPVTADRAS